MSNQSTANNAIRGGRRVWVPLLAVGAVVALAATESLVARSLSNEEQLDAGTVIDFGPGGSMSVEVSEGWELNRAETSPDLRVNLNFDDTNVQLSAVQSAAGTDTDPQQFWDGLDRILDISRESEIDVDLDDPSPYSGTDTDSLTGDLQFGNLSGFVVVVLSENGDSAIFAQVLSTESIDDDAKTATDQLISSLTVAEEGA